jgi:hypothetical protein
VKIKTIVLYPIDFANLRFAAYERNDLNKKLQGSVKVDVFQDHNGCVTFVGQWPDDVDVPE